MLCTTSNVVIKLMLFSKYVIGNRTDLPTHVVHMVAAALGECFACIARVPTEVKLYFYVVHVFSMTERHYFYKFGN